jgi:hypothetical protein
MVVLSANCYLNSSPEIRLNLFTTVRSVYRRSRKQTTLPSAKVPTTGGLREHSTVIGILVHSTQSTDQRMLVRIVMPKGAFPNVVKTVGAGTTSISRDGDAVEEGVSNVDSRLLTIHVAELVTDGVEIHLLAMLTRDSVAMTETSNEQTSDPIRASQYHGSKVTNPLAVLSRKADVARAMGSELPKLRLQDAICTHLNEGSLQEFRSPFHSPDTDVTEGGTTHFKHSNRLTELQSRKVSMSSRRWTDQSLTYCGMCFSELEKSLISRRFTRVPGKAPRVSRKDIGRVLNSHTRRERLFFVICHVCNG